MGFYTVWVRSLGFRGHEPLTYQSDQKLVPGSVVLVSLQREQVLGFVEATVSKPSFGTKPISQALPLPPLPLPSIQLAKWLRDFYGSSIGAVTPLLLPAMLPAKTLEYQSHNVVINSPKTRDLPLLSDEQNAVVKKISQQDTYLLHGKTGSGKTRVYIELAKHQLAIGKSVVILTPEISLTSQLARSFAGIFSEQVLVLHSHLTTAERQRAWVRILRTAQSPAEASLPNSAELGKVQPETAQGRHRVERSAEFGRLASSQPLVIIGPRSALFSPIGNLGLIVIDEAHEPAYKQEQAPYYHARAVASQLAREHGASLVIGSATPSVSDYYLAEQRHKPILRMSRLARPSEHPPTSINIIDLKDRSQFTRSQQLSQPLIEAIQSALSRGEQSLVYLNRRGTARIVLCENCGWQAICPHCDLPLIYHADSGQFRCHTCGFHQPMVTSCPNCGHPSVLFKSFGTKSVAQEVQKLFPQARVQRFDTDNSKTERFEVHYEAVKAGEVDILVGTQLLAKGLDLPRLSTIGLVQADSSLAIPDFSATERTYQLISQALGRVGRGHVAGHAIIQTYHPESPILQAAIKDDYQSFYQTELSERQKFHFPPFVYLLKLTCRRASAKSAEQAAIKLKQQLLQTISKIEVNGPAPSFHEKLQGKYQYQLVVKSPNRSQLLSVIQVLPKSGWSYDIDPVNLL